MIWRFCFRSWGDWFSIRYTMLASSPSPLVFAILASGMSWLLIVVIAYGLNAVAIAIDKALLKRVVPQPLAYTIGITLLGGLTVVLWPIQFALPPATLLPLIMLAGGTFVAGLFCMFSGLQRGDASQVTPLIGGTSPLVVAVLAYIFLSERLSQGQWLGFLVIVAGTVLISWPVSRRRGGAVPRWAIPAAVLFAISYVATKALYSTSEFLPAFIWIRLAAAAVGGLLLLWPGVWPTWRRTFTRSPGSSRAVFGVGQATGAVSMVLVSWAIALTSVSLVNALQGLQYVFLFAIVLGLRSRHPKLLDENLTRRVYLQKIVAIGLIGVGLALFSFLVSPPV